MVDIRDLIIVVLLGIILLLLFNYNQRLEKFENKLNSLKK